jgi:hypothetical protein
VRFGYLDTSCLVAVAFAEPGFEVLIAQLEATEQLFASNVLEAELRSAFRREGVPIDQALLGHVSWVLPGRALSPEIVAVLEAGSVRGADLWHLACALYLSPDPRELAFLTVDRQQAAVAERLGFPGLDLELSAG